MSHGAIKGSSSLLLETWPRRLGHLVAWEEVNLTAGHFGRDLGGS